MQHIRSRSGQATVEYILILSVTVGLASLLVRGVIGTLDSGVLYLGANLERDLQTGRMPVELWHEQ